MVQTRWVLAALLLIPLADALLLVFVAGALGWVPTVALVVLTALLGMVFVRAEGRHTIRGIKRKIPRGEEPTDEVIDAGLLIAAGAFLLTPGLVTDTVGFLLAIPPTRYVVRAALKRYVLVPYLDKRTGGFVTGGVYGGGFPNQERAGETRAGTGPGTGTDTGSTESSGEGTTVDLGSGEYSVDDDEDRPPA
jgi:UPF0716 protein FxsA